jgi:hypothetical protein
MPFGRPQPIFLGGKIKHHAAVDSVFLDRKRLAERLER